jgi:hypothetical protein
MLLCQPVVVPVLVVLVVLVLLVTAPEVSSTIGRVLVLVLLALVLVLQQYSC